MLGDAGQRNGRSAGTLGVRPSSPAIPGEAAGGTPPPGGAFAEPRTFIPLLGGEVHLALVFSGGPGEVSSPLRILVP